MNLLNRIHRKNILVVGDIMLDTYYSGEVKRISPEAPVPVFHKLDERSVPGGAANVAANLAAADQAVAILSVTGADRAGQQLKTHLETMDIDTGMVYQCKACTTEKVRFIAESNQQIMRLDNEEAEGIAPEICQRLLALLEESIDGFDMVILSDYNKGLLTEAFTQGVIALAQSRGKRTLVDVKGNNAQKYRGAYLVKPNLSELHDMTNLPVKTDEEIVRASYKLRELCGADYILTTCGGKGMLLIGGERPMFVNADDHEVFDVTGAGDTALAYLAVALVNGFSVEEAVEVANHAAGVQVTKAGTTAIGLGEVNEVIYGTNEDTIGKLLDWKGAAKLREFNRGKKIVFTNGCFDILHVGHMRYLRQAAKLGDLLVVGLNSDASVKRLKGESRPINAEKDRAEMLASLAFVDYVVIFDQDTPYELIQLVRPDVLVKGKDYAGKEVVGRDIVEDGGGRVILIDFVEGKSTTGIISRILEGERQ